MKKEKISTLKLLSCIFRNLIGVSFAIIIPFIYFLACFGNGMYHGHPQLDPALFFGIIIMVFVLYICALGKSVIVPLKFILWFEAILLLLSLIGMFFGLYIIN